MKRILYVYGLPLAVGAALGALLLLWALTGCTKQQPLSPAAPAAKVITLEAFNAAMLAAPDLYQFTVTKHTNKQGVDVPLTRPEMSRATTFSAPTGSIYQPEPCITWLLPLNIRQAGSTVLLDWVGVDLYPAQLAVQDYKADEWFTALDLRDSSTVTYTRIK